MIDNTFEAQPDRSHYEICRHRLVEIEIESRKRSRFNTAFAILALCLFPFKVPFNGYTLFVDLLGMRNTENLNVTQYFVALICLAMMLLPVLILNKIGTGKHKMGHILLFFFYAIMVGECIMFAGERGVADIFTFIGGLYGMYIHYPAVREREDYKKITQTEGFPYFSKALALRMEKEAEEARELLERYHSDDTEVPADMGDFSNDPADGNNNCLSLPKSVTEDSVMDIVTEDTKSVAMPARGEMRKKRLGIGGEIKKDGEAAPDKTPADAPEKTEDENKPVIPTLDKPKSDEKSPETQTAADVVTEKRLEQPKQKNRNNRNRNNIHNRNNNKNGAKK